MLAQEVARTIRNAPPQTLLIAGSSFEKSKTKKTNEEDGGDEDGRDDKEDDDGYSEESGRAVSPPRRGVTSRRAEVAFCSGPACVLLRGPLRRPAPLRSAHTR